MTHQRILLASGSPRRRELLSLLGLPFEIRPSDYDEEALPPDELSPAEYVTQLAVGKAMVIAHQAEGDALVIGADTTVILDGACLNKPADAEEARGMLARLSGRTHQVYTGLCIVMVQAGRPGITTTDWAVTDVTFDPIAPDVIAAYVASGEPMDKAGAYGIQGKALAFISGIHGDYFNVVGLPLHTLIRMLDALGVSVW